jgi:hypothetical protein
MRTILSAFRWFVNAAKDCSSAELGDVFVIAVVKTQRGVKRPSWMRSILSPRWGCSILVFTFPTACAVGCILTPLRG